MNLFRRKAQDVAPPKVGNVAALNQAGQLLVDAPDAKVLAIVELIDGLTERGAADLVLEPVRGRLRQLRPRRRPALRRLLFAPLEPLIVEARAWHPDDIGISRSALRPFGVVVRRSLGEAWRSAEAGLAALPHDDATGRERVADAMRPAAARALDAAERPASWLAQGLPAASFATLASTTAFLLDAEPRLRDLADPGTDRILVEEGLTALLASAGERGTACWAMLLAMLLQRFPGAEAPLLAATSPAVGLAGADACGAALQFAVQWIADAASVRDVPDPYRAADDIARQVDLLDGFANEPSLRRRAAPLRIALQDGCLARLAVGLQTKIVARLGAAPSHAVLASLERDARGLRGMERESRRLGNGPAYDAQLREVAHRVRLATQFEPMDRLRLIEILAGTAAAMEARHALKI